MGFKPLMESNYYFFSTALARPDSMAVGWKGFFFGPEAAWGVAAVHVNTGEFEYRDADDQLLDADFSMYQQAAMLAFAREFSGSRGILGLGLNLKIIRQGVSDADASLENSDVGFGLDFGAQLQMINPPVIKGLTSAPLIGPFFKLKHLLPLRLGLNIQNLVAPKVGFGQEAEEYPTTLRVGGSYFFDRPKLVERLGLFETSRVTLVSDLEKVFADERRARWYTGVELEGRINDISLMFPRLGYNSSDGPGRFSYGFGLKWAFENMTLQFDFAHGFHPVLDNDPRISLTLTYGGKRDAKYFVRNSQPATSLSRRSTMLHVVSDYPAHWKEIEVAATELQSSLDTANRKRYLDLVGGPSRARYLARQAIEAFQRGDRSAAQEMALLAVEEYQGVVSDAPHIMRDNDYLLYGQCEMISAATDGGKAQDAWRRATAVF
ncbi:MAG: hypothetical protein KAW46_04625, partial [candidate division Zixibacteria bacterium]|nr:hypothetical protein [candidate division Zixibacteria bacterium]